MKLAVLILFLSVASMFAAPPWPQPIRSPAIKFAEVASASLPAGLRAVLLGIDGYSADDGDTLLEQLRICRVDLNQDGQPEFIIENNATGGSGGPAYDIFQRRSSGRYEEIGGFQGGVYLAARSHDGYYQIVSTSRAGGGLYGRHLLRYSKGRYRPVRGSLLKDADF